MGESLALTADSELIQSDDLRGYWQCEVLLYLSGYPTNQDLAELLSTNVESAVAENVSMLVGN